MKRAGVIALATAAALAVLAAGIALRRAAWDASMAERFPPDVLNAYHWGGQANRVGYRNLYRRAERGSHQNRNLYLDYPPLRLLVMARWVRWTRLTFPGVRGWDRSYDFVAPLLRLNTACEVASALLLGALVALWLGRYELTGAGGPRPPPGWVSTPRSRRAGAFAALLVWFDPALLWDAHCWPQWDVWALTFFFAAALAASLDGWWVAGALLGVGSMLKGQLVSVAPFFVLWAVFTRRLPSALRLGLGFATAIAFGGGPWLMGVLRGALIQPSGKAVIWVARAVVAAVLLFPWPALAARPGRRTACVAAAALLLLAPPGAARSPWVLAGLLAALVGAWLARPQPVRSAPLWAATGALCGLIACGGLFRPDLAWVRMGWFYGARHHPALTIGKVANLASLLDAGFPDWAGTAPPSVRATLVAAYALCLGLAAWAAARAARDASPRLLACLALPWLAFFAFLPQMHERYLVFAAVATAGFAAVSLSGLLLHVAVSACALAMMVPVESFPPALVPWLAAGDGLRPAVAWCVLAMTLLWLGLVVRRAPQEKAPHPPT